MFKRHTLAPLTALLVLIMAFLVPVGQASAHQAGPPSPAYCCAYLSIYPNTVVVGQTVHITGSGFPTGVFETVNIYVDNPSTPLAYTAGTDANGNFSIYAPIYPFPSEGSGYHALVAIGQYSGQSAETAFTVRPTVQLQPVSGTRGSFVRITGNGFDRYESIQLTWDYPYQIVGYASAIRNGTFSFSFTVPRNTPRGTHTVTATGQTNRLVAQTHFTVR